MMMLKSLPVFLILARASPFIAPLTVAAQFTSTTMNPTIGREIYVPTDVDKMTSDAKSWYLKGVANAEKDLTKFEPIASLLTKGSDTYKPELKTELKSLLAQAEEANENTKVLYPRLRGLIDSMDEWTKDQPISFWSKMKLKATMWYIEGKRDNKSYYLQNGAGLWVKLRVDKYLKPIYDKSTEAETVGKMLDGLKEDLLEARDELDEAAQEYVKGMEKLTTLVKDVGKNGSQIRRIVKEMKASGEEHGDKIISTAQKSVDNIKEQIEKL